MQASYSCASAGMPFACIYLPRVTIGGIGWFLIRVLIIQTYAIVYWYEYWITRGNLPGRVLLIKTAVDTRYDLMVTDKEVEVNATNIRLRWHRWMLM